MKFPALVLAACGAVASAVDIPPCDLDKLNKLAAGPNGAERKRKFQEASAPAVAPAAPALSMMALSNAPTYTDPQLDVLCLNGACIRDFKEIKAAEPKECVYHAGDLYVLLYRDDINPIEDQCKAKGKTPAPDPGQKPTITPVPPPRPGCKDGA